MKAKIYSVDVKKLATVMAIALLALTIFLPQWCPAASGDLDPTFGVNGKVITRFSSGYAVIYGMAYQADGKIVAVGATETGGPSGRDFALARYNPDGSLDTSFDYDGLVVTDFGSRDEAAASVAIQADGKIVVAGYTNKNFAVARYTSKGGLDATFGNKGLTTTDFNNSSDWIAGIAIQPNGKIIAVGMAGVSASSGEADFGLARYNQDGTLDSSFGPKGRGHFTTDFAADFDAAQDVALQPDGKIVVVGRAVAGKATWLDFGIARYNADGTLDTTFGEKGNGLVTTDFGTYYGFMRDFAGSVIIQPDGKILVGGHSETSGANGFDFALARYEPDGRLDIGFGDKGRVTTNLVSDSDIGCSMALQADGGIIVAGWSSNNYAKNSDFLLAKYKTNGSPDPDFGTDGKITTDFSGRWDHPNAIAVLPGGQILVAGPSATNGPFHEATVTGCSFALARYKDIN